MTVNAAGGTRFYIGTTLSINQNQSESAVVAEFATDTYTEVAEIENLGEFGDEANVITFASLADTRVRKFKGARDAGTMAIVCGDDPLDLGQDAMIAAEGQPNDYNFKVVLNDPITLSGLTSVHYFRGKVLSKRLQVNDVNSIVKRMFSVGVNSAIFASNPN